MDTWHVRAGSEGEREQPKKEGRDEGTQQRRASAWRCGGGGRLLMARKDQRIFREEGGGVSEEGK